MENLRAVNPDSVSKVVDENGEPLVVYLGRALLIPRSSTRVGSAPESCSQQMPGAGFTSRRTGNWPSDTGRGLFLLSLLVIRSF